MCECLGTHSSRIDLKTINNLAEQLSVLLAMCRGRRPRQGQHCNIFPVHYRTDGVVDGSAIPMSIMQPLDINIQFIPDALEPLSLLSPNLGVNLASGIPGAFELCQYISLARFA